jgi:hypothetical protein
VKERHHLEDIGGDGTILKGSFKRLEECGMDPFGLGQRPVAGYCKQSNETVKFMNNQQTDFLAVYYFILSLLHVSTRAFHYQGALPYLLGYMRIECNG